MPIETNTGPAMRPSLADESFHVRDAKSANWVLKKIVSERDYRARCNDWYEAEMRRSERREQFLMHRFSGELAAWARQELTNQYGKRRSLRLPAGTIGFRLTQPKLIVTDESKLIGWCKTYLPTAVRMVEKILKTEVHAYTKTTGEIADGTEITPSA